MDKNKTQFTEIVNDKELSSMFENVKKFCDDTPVEFINWWYNIGSGLYSKPGSDMEEHASFVSRAAWMAAKQKTITPEEFKNAIQKAFDDNIEEGHGKADDIMCELLESLGYGEGVQVFKSSKKYYS